MQQIEVDVGQILADLELRGWQAKDLATEARLSKSTISRFLDGTFQTAPTMKKIAAALGYSIKRYARRKAS